MWIAIFVLCLFAGDFSVLASDDQFVKSDESFQEWVLDDRNSLYPTLPIAAPVSKNEQCRKDSQLLISHLANKTLWALQSKS